MRPPARHLAATRGKTDPAEQEFSVGFVCRGLVGAVFRPFLTPLVTKRSRNGRPRVQNPGSDSSANWIGPIYFIRKISTFVIFLGEDQDLILKCRPSPMLVITNQFGFQPGLASYALPKIGRAHV